MSRSVFRLAAATCAVSALTLAARAQQPPTFGDEIDVRVVNIEVVATGRDGQRVLDLKPADFRLLVDGKEVPVEYFSEVRAGNAVGGAAGEAPPGEAAVQSVAPQGAVGTFYLVFIDDYFSIAHHRNQVLAALKADLAHLGPEDRMAMVTYDGGRLAMLADGLGSRSDLERAFDQAMARPARGLERVVERRALRSGEALVKLAEASVAQQGDQSRPGQTLSTSSTVGLQNPVLGGAMNIGLNEREKAYGETLVRQIRGSTGAAVSAMRGFGAPRGRKVMLLLSGGWPFSVASFIRGAEDVPPSRQTASGEDIFRTLAGTANLLGYTLYPVDVPGVQTAAADVEAEAASGGFGGLSEQETEGSLHFLAQETGGKPLLNSNRTLALASASADTRSYYWLGFTPNWQRNDKFHDVKVEARRPGLDLRYRTSFRDLSRKAEVSMKVESALLFGKLPGAVSMPMRLGAVRSKKGGLEMEIPVTLGLPTDLMTVLLPADGKYTVQLELRFAASDANGNSSEIPVLPLTLSSEKPPAPGKVVRYETTLKLRGAAEHLVVAVYDPLSGKVATAEADLAAQ